MIVRVKSSWEVTPLNNNARKIDLLSYYKYSSSSGEMKESKKKKKNEKGEKMKSFCLE